MLNEFHKKILTALADSSGQLSTSELKSLYSEIGDGQRVSFLIKHNLAEWVRPLDSPIDGSAVAIRITDVGRKVLTDINN